jgi:hypothetical protein
VGKALKTATDELLETLSSCFSAESARRLADFDIDPDLQARIEMLLNVRATCAE